MSDTIPPAIAPQLAQACTIIHRHLGDLLVAIHLFGSAVDGGLQPCSDIDLLVTVSAPPGEAVRRALMAALLTVSAPPASSPSLRALEVTVLTLAKVVPWRYPPQREIQFGEWLRDDLFAGKFEEPASDHDLAILLTQIRSASIAVVGPQAHTLFDEVPAADLRQALLDTVAQWNGPADWAGDERNIVLALARSWYTATTGEISSKAHAATWLLDRIERPYRAVLSTARASYRSEQADDLSARPREVEAFIAHAQRQVRRLCASA